MGITSDSADMKLLVARFDSSEDSRLSFWEFAHIFTPIEPTLADDLPRRGRLARDGMSAETRDRVADLLRVTIDSECMVESIRQQTEKGLGRSLREVFDALDWLKRGFLTGSEFRRYFDGYPDETTQLREAAARTFNSNANTSMEGLLRRFNKDKLNGRVSLPEFMDGLTPKCPERRF